MSKMTNLMANELKENLSVMTIAAGTDRNVVTGSNVYFTGKKIVLYSGDVYIDKPMETDFEGGVDAALLEDVADKYGNNEIEIYRVENEIILKRKRSVSKLVVNDNATFPEIKFSEDVEWRKIPVDFATLIEQACALTSNNFNEPAKTCIHINGRKMEASDGFHFGIFRMKGNIQDDLFIRKDFVKILSKFEPSEYRLSDSWICFRNGKEYFLAVRKITIADYPNLTELFENSKGEIEVELPDKVISSLERAKLFLRNEVEFDRYIKMEAKEGKITISTETKTGSYRDRISGAEDLEFSVLINPEYLVEMLFHTNKLFIGDMAISCETKNVKMAGCLVG